MKILSYFLAANLLIGGIYYTLAYFSNTIGLFAYKTELMTFYGLQSLMVMLIGQYTQSKFPLQGLLGITLLRLLTSAFFLGWRLFSNIQNPTQYVFHFVILYFAYLCFEIACFLPKLPPRKLS